MRQLVGPPDEECIAVDVRDRFGDYGLVGVVICSSRGSVVTESMIMSCRALGRGVEHRLVAYLGERAIAGSSGLSRFRTFRPHRTSDAAVSAVPGRGR